MRQSLVAMAESKKITVAGFSIRADRICTRFLPQYEGVPILEIAGRPEVSAWTLHAEFRKTRAAEYFVDEAGDPVLFNTRKQVIVGTEGCSRFFILGMAWVLDPSKVTRDLESLRQGVLADPYFKGVPSLLPANKKTALLFHAKDDLPEIRREVFRVLMKHPIQFFAVVRDKRTVVAEVWRAADDRTAPTRFAARSKDHVNGFARNGESRAMRLSQHTLRRRTTSFACRPATTCYGRYSDFMRRVKNGISTLSGQPCG
jgi:hypothetical protein